MENYAVKMREIMSEQHFLCVPPWTSVVTQILDLVVVIEQYCLRLRNQRMRNNVAKHTPRSKLEIETNVTVIKAHKTGFVHNMLTELNKELLNKEFASSCPSLRDEECTTPSKN